MPVSKVSNLGVTVSKTPEKPDMSLKNQIWICFPPKLFTRGHIPIKIQLICKDAIIFFLNITLHALSPPSEIHSTTLSAKSKEDTPTRRAKLKPFPNCSFYYSEAIMVRLTIVLHKRFESFPGCSYVRLTKHPSSVTFLIRFGHIYLIHLCGVMSFTHDKFPRLSNQRKWGTYMTL